MNTTDSTRRTATPEDFEGWYCIRTKQYAERRVVDELDALGVESYLPLERHEAKRNRRTIVVERPLLLRYLFAYIKLKGDFYRIKNTRGVDVFLSLDGSGPSMVPDRQIDRLRTLEAHGRFDKTVKHVAIFETDQEVRIIDGPFKDLLGIIEQGGEAGTFHVLAALFGRITRVQLEAGQMEPVKRQRDREMEAA